LTVTERTAVGLQGGVAKIVALTATLVRQASLTRDQFPPFFDPRGDHLCCKDPEDLLFNGVDAEIKKNELAALQPEPEWFSWDRPPTYGPELFEKVPAVYLVCKEDRATPVEAQKMWADAAKAEIKECDAGHMVMLSHPEVVVDVVKGAAESIS
jgi:pimeloyl-ACP methyl ester carboxylesterase